MVTNVSMSHVLFSFFSLSFYFVLFIHIFLDGHFVRRVRAAAAASSLSSMDIRLLACAVAATGDNGSATVQ